MGETSKNFSRLALSSYGVWRIISAKSAGVFFRYNASVYMIVPCAHHSFQYNASVSLESVNPFNGLRVCLSLAIAVLLRCCWVNPVQHTSPSSAITKPLPFSLGLC
jgi:hypothetical protein